MFHKQISQLFHYGPIIAMLIIFWITINGFNCLLKWFPLNRYDPLSIINFIVSWFWFIMIFYNYLQCIFRGPGFLPKYWRPELKEHEKYLQYCNICKGFKAPRAHHCKTCQRCILKFDHHCPWINTCLGYKNHANFCWFLFSSILGCIHALSMICPCIYRVLFIPYIPWKNEPRIDFSTNTLLSSILSIGFSIGVIIALGFLLIIQLKNIIYNRTTIENWIVQKAYHRNQQRLEPFVYPYDLGLKENIRQVFNWKDSFQLVGDGITWSVRSNCDQYTLTREQLEQKIDKQQRSVRYKVIKSYNGAFFPINYDLWTCICIPYLMESRLRISKGDYLLVTRWKEYWLYGKFIKSDTIIEQFRGWFPRCCVRESMDMNNLWWDTSSIEFSSNLYERNDMNMKKLS